METPSLSAHPGHGKSRMGGQWDLLSDVRVLRPTLSPQPPAVCLVVPGQLVNNFTRDLASLFLSWKPPPPSFFFFFLITAVSHCHRFILSYVDIDIKS